MEKEEGKERTVAGGEGEKETAEKKINSWLNEEGCGNVSGIGKRGEEGG